MLKNYLVVALRTLRKRPLYAAINGGGLALGIASCVLIALFVRSELAFDRFHEDADRLYRAWVHEVDYGRQLQNVFTPLPLAPQLRADFPEVEAAVRLFSVTDLVRRGDLQFKERLHVADTAFFEVFSFPLVHGDPTTALDAPDGVVLTEAMARKYFGTTDALGERLEVRIGGAIRPLTVTGIAQAPPAASSIQFDVVLPWALNGFRESSKTAWFQVYVETYVKLRPEATQAGLAAKLPSMVRRVLGDRYEEGTYTVHLQPITAIHLDQSLPAGIEPTSDPAYATILAIVASFILLIACINFTTLSLGQSAERAREVGVRKALGAPRRALMQQFFGETLVLAGGALVLGLALAHTARPLFEQLAGRPLPMELDGTLLLLLVGIVLFIGLVAGSYPAVRLSGFQPTQALKGHLRVRGDRSILQRGLVVLQFSLAIFLAAGTLYVVHQLNFLQSKNLGFTDEQVVMVPTTGRFADGFATYERLNQALADRPEAVRATVLSFAFADSWARVGFDDEAGVYQTFNANFAGYDFVETFGIEMSAGRAFDRAVPSDTARGVLVNEALVRQLGLEAPIGQRLPNPDYPDHEIIGVMKDFHHASLRVAIEPLAVAANPDLLLRGADNVNFPGDPTPDIAVRLRGEDLPAELAALKAAWTEVAPDQPFSFSFVDQALARQYEREQRLGHLVQVAAGLALLIAGFGLFGLAALAAARRTKEIGVRKTLGASVPNLVALLTFDFVRLVGVAFVVAAPLAYLAADRWLSDFAYHITPGFGTLALAGLGAAAIALLAVGVHALRTARANPITALRYE